MFLRVVATSTVASLPLAYSFCASMIISVLSRGEAVEGDTPMSCRKEDGVGSPILSVCTGC